MEFHSDLQTRQLGLLFLYQLKNPLMGLGFKPLVFFESENSATALVKAFMKRYVNYLEIYPGDEKKLCVFTQSHEDAKLLQHLITLHDNYDSKEYPILYTAAYPAVEWRTTAEEVSHREDMWEYWQAPLSDAAHWMKIIVYNDVECLDSIFTDQYSTRKKMTFDAYDGHSYVFLGMPPCFHNIIGARHNAADVVEFICNKAVPYYHLLRQYMSTYSQNLTLPDVLEDDEKDSEQDCNESVFILLSK